MVVNLNNESEIPMYAEPWFLSFNADVQFKIAMTRFLINSNQCIFGIH